MVSELGLDSSSGTAIGQMAAQIQPNSTVLHFAVLVTFTCENIHIYAAKIHNKCVTLATRASVRNVKALFRQQSMKCCFVHILFIMCTVGVLNPHL